MTKTEEDGKALWDFMPPPIPVEEITAYAGVPLIDKSSVATKEMVIESLRTVYDPEIPVNIYDLGLVYELDIRTDGAVQVKMTLTAPGCPVAGIMPQMIADAAAGIDGTGEVEVTLVWDPPWNKDMMSEDAKLALGIF